MGLRRRHIKALSINKPTPVGCRIDMGIENTLEDLLWDTTGRRIRDRVHSKVTYCIDSASWGNTMIWQALQEELGGIRW